MKDSYNLTLLEKLCTKIQDGIHFFMFITHIHLVNAATLEPFDGVTW